MNWKTQQLHQMSQILLVNGFGVLVAVTVLTTIVVSSFLSLINLVLACFGATIWFWASSIVYKEWFSCLRKGMNLNHKPIKVISILPSLNLRIVGLPFRRGVYVLIWLIMLGNLAFQGLLILLHPIFLLWLGSGLSFSIAASILVGQGLWYQSLYKRLNELEKRLGCELIFKTNSSPDKWKGFLTRGGPNAITVVYYRPAEPVKDRIVIDL